MNGEIWNIKTNWKTNGSGLISVIQKKNKLLSHMPDSANIMMLSNGKILIILFQLPSHSFWEEINSTQISSDVYNVSRSILVQMLSEQANLMNYILQFVEKPSYKNKAI